MSRSIENQEFEKLIEDAEVKYSVINKIFPIRQLITPSPNSRAKATPRPLNPFLTFRRYYNKLLCGSGAYENVGKTSARAAKAWKALSETDKDDWNELSQLAKYAHGRLFPDYKFQPRQQKKKGLTQPLSRLTTKTTCIPTFATHNLSISDNMTCSFPSVSSPDQDVVNHTSDIIDLVPITGYVNADIFPEEATYMLPPQEDNGFFTQGLVNTLLFEILDPQTILSSSLASSQQWSLF